MQLLTRVLPNLSQDTEFTFTERPALALPDDRLSYRLALLAAALDSCRRSRGSYARLAVLTFAARSPRLRSRLERLLYHIDSPDDIVIRFDPYFPRVLDIAVASRLVKADNNAMFALAPRGV